jgi:shikimate kinase/3-dehydroquinate synthase
VKVLLVGLPGSGGTTVGTLLGQRLGCPFLDDDALVARAGTGEHAMTLLMAMPGDLVAVVPDEVVDDAQARARIQASDAHVVWLRCSVPVLARRMTAKWGQDAATRLRRLVADRGGVYQELADQVVDTDAHPAGAVANTIIGTLAPS